MKKKSFSVVTEGSDLMKRFHASTVKSAGSQKVKQCQAHEMKNS